MPVGLTVRTAAMASCDGSQPRPSGIGKADNSSRFSRSLSALRCASSRSNETDMPLAWALRSPRTTICQLNVGFAAVISQVMPVSDRTDNRTQSAPTRTHSKESPTHRCGSPVPDGVALRQRPRQRQGCGMSDDDLPLSEAAELYEQCVRKIPFADEGQAGRAAPPH